MNSVPAGADIEGIERATIAAVSPELIEELDGWLLPFDGGTVKRARSAMPLHRDPADGAHRVLALAGLAQAALARGFERVFLQVEARNLPAQSLYRRAGFETQWQYRCWQRQH